MAVRLSLHLIRSLYMSRAGQGCSSSILETDEHCKGSTTTASSHISFQRCPVFLSSPLVSPECSLKCMLLLFHDVMQGTSPCHIAALGSQTDTPMRRASSPPCLLCTLPDWPVKLHEPQCKQHQKIWGRTCRCRACLARRLTALSLRSALSCCTRVTARRSAGSSTTARFCSRVWRLRAACTLGLLLKGRSACTASQQPPFMHLCFAPGKLTFHMLF